MARITVQNAVEKVGNRFNLVLIAARRARQIQMNKQSVSVSKKEDKYTVVALREIENGIISEKFSDLLTFN